MRLVLPASLLALLACNATSPTVSQPGEQGPFAAGIRVSPASAQIFLAACTFITTDYSAVDDRGVDLPEIPVTVEVEQPWNVGLRGDTLRALAPGGRSRVTYRVVQGDARFEHVLEIISPTFPSSC